MNYAEMRLRGTYDSIIDDVYNDLFNPVLSNTKTHLRIAGVFNSRNFASCAEGLQKFIENDGKMKIILSQVMSNDDSEAIIQGSKTQENIIIDNWINEIAEIKDKFESDHVKALAWMLKNDLLEIKIIIVKDKNGKIVTDAERINILQKKLGIFFGEDNDQILSFEGTIDFNDPIFGEYYHINLFRYWDDSEKKWVNEHNSIFNKYWSGEIMENEGYTFTIIELPEAIKNNLMTISPKSKDDICLTKKHVLRSYQKNAIEQWIENDHIGIFEMATGTGKTITAINAILKLQSLQPNLLIVIVCPYTTLVHQWKNELQKFNIPSMITVDNSRWKNDLNDLIFLSSNNQFVGIKAIITTYVTYSNPEFIKIIAKSKKPLMLLADEVHHGGSATYVRGLDANYHYRLGLTATLERYFDPDGTKKLMAYFDKVVFTYDLAQAINDKVLIEYYYHPIYLDLTEEERENYQLESRKIAMYSNNNDKEYILKRERALLRRSKIMRDAANKIPTFNNLINENNTLKHTLIYCSEKQIDSVQKILTERIPQPISSRRITAKDPSNNEGREKIIRGLVNEDYQAIVAIQILDEGIDIPEAKNIILLASTGNPKQFIQRRGRVLRRFSGSYKDGTTKDFATIYDLLIIPKIFKNMSESEQKSELSILRSQIKRQIEMAKIAKNSDTCLQEISSILENLGIDFSDDEVSPDLLK